MQIQRQLAGMRKKESIIEYFNKVKHLTDTLASVGNHLTDKEVIMYMLSGLDNECDSLVTSITTRPYVISSNDLYAHLPSFEMRIALPTTIPSIRSQILQQILCLVTTSIVDLGTAIVVEVVASVDISKEMAHIHALTKEDLFVRYVASLGMLRSSVITGLIIPTSWKTLE